MNFFLEAAKSLPRLFPLLFLRNGLSFPAPTGPYNTSLVTVALTDTHRSDPFAPTQQSRVLMISVFTPVLPSACIPLLSSYMEPTTAAFEDARLEAYGLPSGVFESLNLQTCQQDPINHKQFPLLLFSPAAGTTRLFYSAIAQQIASTGYLVVTIDHPYDADIVVFPDNTTVFGLNFTDAQIPLVVDTRAKDISFVLDIFSKTTLHHSFHGRVKAGVFGHSLGGAASAQAMFTDPRFQGGLNLDGTFFGDVVEKGLDRPFLIFAHDGKNLTNDPSWDATWPKLTGWKREMMLADRFGGMLPIEVGDILGSIDGRRAFEIVTTYTESFFDKILKGKKSEILDGPDKRYPEVTFGGF